MPNCYTMIMISMLTKYMGSLLIGFSLLLLIQQLFH